MAPFVEDQTNQSRHPFRNDKCYGNGEDAGLRIGKPCLNSSGFPLDFSRNFLHSAAHGIFVTIEPVAFLIVEQQRLDVSRVVQLFFNGVLQFVENMGDVRGFLLSPFPQSFV